MPKKDYYSHPDQDPNSMIPHHESFGRHWLNHHHYLASTILALFLIAVLSVVYWWQMDNFKIDLAALTQNNQAQNQDNNPGNPAACIQVIAWAQNGETGEIKSFSTPCDIPSGWAAIDLDSNLLSVKKYGGLCLTGTVCEEWLTITKSGDLLQDSVVKGKLTSSELNRLNSQINNLDFEEIKSTEFSGTCPVAYDGQENVYMFYQVNNTEVETLPSCTYEIDEESPGVFATILDLIEKYNN